MSAVLRASAASSKTDSVELPRALTRDAPPREAGAAAWEVDSDPIVDLQPLKHAAKHLPEGDPIRRLIEGEPDCLPRSVLAAKADSWVLLLLRAG